MAEGLEWLRQSQLPHGRWPLESTPYGRMQANLEKRGQRSKWITLKALEVCQRMEGHRRG
jgi:hypothetical protein